MRLLKLTSVLGLAILLSAVATASALKPSFLPGKAATSFTGKSGALVWQTKGGGAIACGASEISKGAGELLGSTSLLFVATFTKCAFAGITMNSLGDASGIILVHMEGETCTISTSPLVGGLLLKPLPLHLEVPSTKLLLTLEGSFVGTLSPENKSTLVITPTFTQKEGKQTVEGCLNEAGTKVEPETLLWGADGGTPVQTALEFKEDSLTFAVAQEFMT
jgi:hypothetical protein